MLSTQKIIPISALLLLVLTQKSSCTLKLLSPKTLKDSIAQKNNNSTALNYTLATFGSIPYGMNVMGYAHFDENNELGCNSSIISPYSPHDVTPFMVVRRGTCEFIVKVNIDLKKSILMTIRKPT